MVSRTPGCWRATPRPPPTPTCPLRPGVHPFEPRVVAGSQPHRAAGQSPRCAHQCQVGGGPSPRTRARGGGQPRPRLTLVATAAVDRWGARSTRPRGSRVLGTHAENAGTAISHIWERSQFCRTSLRSLPFLFYWCVTRGLSVVRRTLNREPYVSWRWRKIGVFSLRSMTQPALLLPRLVLQPSAPPATPAAAAIFLVAVSRADAQLHPDPPGDERRQARPPPGGHLPE